MRNVGISAKISAPEALCCAREIASNLRQRGLNVCFDEATAREVNDANRSYSKSELGNHSDLLITFGGDGTLLSVARHAPSHVPIIGVNMGTLGFLTEIRLEELPAFLERVLAGDYKAESRVAFDVVVNGRDRDGRRYRVLNDVAINKSALARIIEMRVEVSGQFVSNFRADGLIISTPTGSTAYNLSAGGPIIFPTMGAMVITPICPHMLTNRPIVVPDTLEVEIAFNTPHQEIYVTLDGQEGLDINEGDHVCVSKSAQTVLLAQSPDKNYFDVLRGKLKWGES